MKIPPYICTVKLVIMEKTKFNWTAFWVFLFILAVVIINWYYIIKFLKQLLC